MGDRWVARPLLGVADLVAKKRMIKKKLPTPMEFPSYALIVDLSFRAPSRQVLFSPRLGRIMKERAVGHDR